MSSYKPAYVKKRDADGRYIYVFGRYGRPHQRHEVNASTQQEAETKLLEKHGHHIGDYLLILRYPVYGGYTGI